MINKQVNLTQLCIAKEIKHLLLESKEDKDNSILRDPAYQKLIIKYALSELSHRYMTLENITEIPLAAEEIFPECPIQERTAILQLLQKKMLDIVRFNLEKSAPTEFAAEREMLEEPR